PALVRQRNIFKSNSSHSYSCFIIFATMRVKEEIKSRTEEFLGLCKNHKVTFLYAFGSSTNQAFDETKSDIDLLVEVDAIDPMVRGETLIDLWDKLELFFGRKVDLLTESSLKNPYLRANIDQSKILIYDGKREEVFV
ncbi:nucleotidyltransferase family protein, partial [Pleomorphovibrio marinus]|uniref:nucleotidyltransferase family protein n=1 Tax=Pleomorphovibrio marinus TaxID=2164132 RepID=UPI001E4E4F02